MSRSDRSMARKKHIRAKAGSRAAEIQSFTSRMFAHADNEGLSSCERDYSSEDDVFFPILVAISGDLTIPSDPLPPTGERSGE